MEIGGVLVVEFVNEFLEGLLLLGGVLQLKEHVLQREIVGHGATIVCGSGFGACVALEGDMIRFIDALRDSWARTRAGSLLGEASRHSRQRSEDSCGEEPEFAKHGSLLS
jgi:hypothetical protein